MPKLILIKHARPIIDPTTPTSQWTLSPEGIASCRPLADALKPHQPSRLIASIEPKAMQTAEHVAGHLDLPVESAPDLEEHHRDDVPHLDTRDFLAAMAQVFKFPTRRVLGEETAQHALDRFVDAVDAALDQHPNDTLAIVTHGTVIALYAAYFNDLDPYQLWRQMTLPSFLVFNSEDHQILHRQLTI